LRLMECINYGNKNNNNSNTKQHEENKSLAEMKFEYESLQSSWKMHRDRLQEYVMAYKDAIAKLKHSYYQRDKLTQKCEQLTEQLKQLEGSQTIYKQQLQQFANTLPMLQNALSQGQQLKLSNGAVNNNNNTNNNNNRQKTSQASNNNNSEDNNNEDHTSEPMSPLPKQIIIDIPQPSLNLNSTNTTKSNKEMKIHKLKLELIHLDAIKKFTELNEPNSTQLKKPLSSKFKKSHNKSTIWKTQTLTTILILFGNKQ